MWIKLDGLALCTLTVQVLMVELMLVSVAAMVAVCMTSLVIPKNITIWLYKCHAN